MVHRELTDSKKGVIIGYHSSGTQISKIVLETGHLHSTVDSVIKHFLTRHHTDNALCSGGPQKLSPHNERTLLHKVKLSATHQGQTWAQLQTTFPHQVSILTLSHSLARNGIRKWRTVTKPYLTPKNAQKHKEWAQTYHDWTEEDWRSVVWSDECSVARSKDASQTWVFCFPNKRWHCDCVDPWPPSKDISLMVWGCFAGNLRGPMAPLIMPSVNSCLYLATLENLLPPIMDRLRNIWETPIFMHNNAPVHTAYIVQDWLEDQDFEVMVWPPYNIPYTTKLGFRWL